jgi:hypothetical protein
VGNGLAVGVVEDRQVVGGCPVAEVPDPVGLVSVAVDERAGQLPGLLPTDQVVHLQGEWQQRNEVVGRVGVVQSRCRGAAVDDQFEVMALSRCIVAVGEAGGVVAVELVVDLGVGDAVAVGLAGVVSLARSGWRRR